MAGIFAENCIYEQVEKYLIHHIYINNTYMVNCFDFDFTAQMLPKQLAFISLIYWNTKKIIT